MNIGLYTFPNERANDSRVIIAVAMCWSRCQLAQRWSSAGARVPCEFVIPRVPPPRRVRSSTSCRHAHQSQTDATRRRQTTLCRFTAQSTCVELRGSLKRFLKYRGVKTALTANKKKWKIDVFLFENAYIVVRCLSIFCYFCGGSEPQLFLRFPTCLPFCQSLEYRPTQNCVNELL